MADDGTTTYQLWQTAAGHAFFEENNQAAREFVGPGGALVWSVKAKTWEEARSRMHEFLGWPPYRPTEAATALPTPGRSAA